MTLVNCTVKQGKFNPTLEMATSKHRKVKSSPKKFKLDVLHFREERSTTVEGTVEEVANLAVGQHSTVAGELVKVGALAA